MHEKSQVLRMLSSRTSADFDDLFPVLEGLVQRSSTSMVHGSAAGLAKKRIHGFLRPMMLKSSVRTSRKAARRKIHICNHTCISLRCEDLIAEI